MLSIGYTLPLPALNSISSSKSFTPYSTASNAEHSSVCEIYSSNEDTIFFKASMYEEASRLSGEMTPAPP